MDLQESGPGMELLSIRSSDIAFAMELKGILEKQADMMVIPLLSVTIPNLWRITIVDKAVIYIHGKNW